MISSSVSYTVGGETLNKLNKTLERREVFNLNSTHALLATDALFFPSPRTDALFFFPQRNLRLLQMRRRGGASPAHTNASYPFEGCG